MCEIGSKSRVKIPERRQWHGFGVFIFNFEQSLYSSVSIVNFKQVNTGLFVPINCPIPYRGKKSRGKVTKFFASD